MSGNEKAARLRHADALTLDMMLKAYEELLSDLSPYSPEDSIPN